MIDVPVQVKDALREGNYRKNYRVVVLNTDGTEDFTIDNDNLVKESVSIDERMCSGDTLKFGLCEGSSLEFRYFNRPNITGRQVQVFCDVEYGEENPYAIPIGFFIVKNCSRQASTGIIKATAYNKLMSDYLDQKANLTLQDEYTQDYEVTLHDIRETLLEGYQIVEDRSKIGVDLPPLSVTTHTLCDLGRFKFNSLYGVKSPINAHRFGITSTETEFTINTFAELAQYYGNGGSIKVDSYYGNLIGLEKNIVEYLKNLINSSNLNKTWDDVLDYICTHDGFQSIIGFSVTKSRVVSGTIVFYTETYSTVQWEYEEAHGLQHTVDGTILDGQRLTNYYDRPCNVNVPEHIQWDIDFYGPATFYLDGKAYSRTTHNNEDYYEYYADETLTTLAREDCPYLQFSDNTKYQSSIEDGGIYYYSILQFNYNNLADADKITMTISNLPEFTLREITSAVFETVAQFGQLDRVTDLFSGVELNHSRLLPADTLYPDNALYPYGAQVSSFRSQYSKLWADEGNVRKWRYLIITYKGLDDDGNETEFTLQRTINNDGTDDYNCSDNWLFRNLVWTATDISTYADAMVAKMQSVTWFPFEMWCAGLPYLETGDEIEIPLGEEVYTSYILQRQLKGIQNLQDTYINGTLDIF